jgi:hypothetical protein
LFVPLTEIFDFTTLLDLYFLFGYIVACFDEPHEAKPPHTAIKPTTNVSDNRTFAHFFILSMIYTFNL